VRINLLLMYTSHFIEWQDYQNTFINVAGSSLEHIRDRLSAFIVSGVISPKGEFHFKLYVLS
jgi:hypothetical protein